MTEQHIDVAIVGGGPVGLIAALLIARTGAATVHVAPPPPPDARTTALLDGSVAILKSAGLWDGLAAIAAPLRKLRIADGGRRLFRAPEALFDAAEMGLDAFGWNVPNAALTATLTEAYGRVPGARRVFEAVETARMDDDAVRLSLGDGETLSARVVIAADGRQSSMRKAAGIGFRSRKTGQTALAFTVSHDRPHHGVSTEIHFEDGPFTLVPMPGDRSSVVWVANPAEAEALAALPREDLAEAAGRKCNRLLGRMRIDGAVGAFPITIGAATRFAARRALLVGEAGHVLPPIGAQGLNLGVRDAARAAEVVGKARAGRRDPGGEEALGAYARARAADVWTRTAATDLLNLSLTLDLPPVHALRGIGLSAVSRIGPLRRFVMREGLIGGPAF